MSAARRTPRVVMFGPDLMGHGGISQVASALVEESSLRRFGVLYVPTWVQGTQLRRTIVFLSALLVASRLQHGSLAHVHMASRGSFLRKSLVMFVLRLRGARTVLHLHGAEFHTFAATSGPVRRAAIRWIFRSADVVLVLSPVWKARVAEFSGRADGVVVPNPVRVPRGSAQIEGARKVVFTGRLGDRKGTPELLQAIGILQERGLADVEWVLAGDGEVERFRSIAASLPHPARVTVSGWLGRDEVQRELESAWVFCLPSHDEGKPVALLEAMANGVACIATPVGGVPDLVEDEVTGLLVQVGDVGGLSHALERLLGSRQECLRLGASARALVAREYASATVGGVLGSIYDALLAGEVPVDGSVEPERRDSGRSA